MEVRAVAKDIPISPRKVRLVVDAVRGRKVDEALTMLRFMPQNAARDVYKVVKSAAANAENNYDLDADALWIRSIYADDGRTLKRLWRRNMGRANRLLKRSSHITVVVEDREG
jgi:large subunit ribosomal protein L22